jgi:hypothetical protein
MIGVRWVFAVSSHGHSITILRDIACHDGASFDADSCGSSSASCRHRNELHGEGIHVLPDGS